MIEGFPDILCDSTDYCAARVNFFWYYYDAYDLSFIFNQIRSAYSDFHFRRNYEDKSSSFWLLEELLENIYLYLVWNSS